MLVFRPYENFLEKTLHIPNQLGLKFYCVKLETAALLYERLQIFAFIFCSA